MLRFPLRFWPVFVALVLALFMIVPGSIATAQAASPVYSDPDWWPVHMVSKVDCTHTNNCRTGNHTEWGIDVVGDPGDTSGSYLPIDYGVYAMGAGIVHIGDAHGKTCGFGGDKSDFGTWLWVDHSGGVVSKYGHFATLAVKEGRQVQVGTLLGQMGGTGDARPYKCATEHYVDFQVRHEGITGPSVPFATTDAGTRDGDLLVCTTSGPQRLAEHSGPIPQGAGGPEFPPANTFHRIDDITESTNLIGGTPGCAGAAKYRKGPSKATLRASGRKLKATWSKAPRGVNAVRVELDRRTAAGWKPEKDAKWVDLSAGTTSTKFGSLHAGSQYRVRVWFHTRAGWSSPSARVTSHAP